MAFDFQAYRNPYVSTIADLLSRGEDAKAKALVDTASAQARAAEIRGQAYGGAIENVGKIVSGIPAQIQAGKDQAFKNEQQAQARLEFADKATERAEQAKGKEAVRFLASLDQSPDPNYQRDPATGTSRYEGPPSPDYSNLFDQGDFGQKTFNPAKTRQALNAAGYGAYADKLMVNVGKQNQDIADFVQKRNDTVAQAANHALAMFRAPKADGSQTSWADAVNGVGSSLVANGIYKQSDLDALIASGQDQGRQGQEQLLIGLMRKGSEKAVSLAPGTTTMLGGQVIGVTPSNAKTTIGDVSLAQYQKYVTDTVAAGGTPMSIEEYKRAPVVPPMVTVPGPDGKPVRRPMTAQEMKTGARVYERPRVAAAEYDPNSTKAQEGFEKQYQAILQRTLSSRSGGMGLEDQKVNQAKHLLAIFSQNQDPKTGEYKIPLVLQTELALGLARLVSPTGNVGLELEQKLNQASAKGDVAQLVTYVTGVPVTGSTQEIFKMFRDSIVRQGTVAEQNREAYFDSIRAFAPTDLSEERRTQLEKGLKLNRISTPDAAPKTPIVVGKYKVVVN